MARFSKDIHVYLKDRGYWLKRIGKHEIWTNGKVTLTVSISPSCPHALMNVKKQVEREMKRA